jgi:membrane protein required for colicin V production
LEGVIKLVALGLVNKLFGLLFGATKFLLITAGLLYLIEGFPLTEDVISKKQKDESYLYSPTSAFLSSLYPVLEKKDWRMKIEDAFDEIKEGIDLN